MSAGLTALLPGPGLADAVEDGTAGSGKSGKQAAAAVTYSLAGAAKPVVKAPQPKRERHSLASLKKMTMPGKEAFSPGPAPIFVEKPDPFASR